MKKYIPLILIFVFGGILGGIISAVILVNFIDSQRNQGFHDGFIKAELDVMDFLRENVQNDVFEMKETGKYFTIKDTGIRIVEINGVKTVFIEGTDYEY